MTHRVTPECKFSGHRKVLLVAHKSIMGDDDFVRKMVQIFEMIVDLRTAAWSAESLYCIKAQKLHANQGNAHLRAVDCIA